jgi:AcrR family transcriptional regulator
MDMRTSRAEVRRYSRETWLARALEVLSKEGAGRLHIDRLAALLGVSKGSFYWHFRDRGDFVRSVAQFWADSMTQNVIDAVYAMQEAAPAARLLKVAEMVTHHELARHDLAMRAWAAHEPDLAQVVRKVDQARMQLLQRCFADLGFRGEELALRTRAFVSFFAFEHAFTVRESRAARLRKLKRRVQFFTRP